jgi:hypothetical protein
MEAAFVATKRRDFGGQVPETGFEPAHPFGRYHLKVVRLPISPPGQICLGLKFIVYRLQLVVQFLNAPTFSTGKNAKLQRIQIGRQK